MRPHLSWPHRLDGRLLAVGVSALFVPLSWVVSLLAGQGLGPHVLYGVPCAGVVAVLSLRFPGLLGDAVIASMLILQAMLQTAQFTGHSWQTDTHVVFFVLLAIVSTLGSIRVLALACGLTAAFFVGTGFFWSDLAWSAIGAAAAVLRGGLHVVLVCLEGGVLAASILQQRGTREQIDLANTHLETERRMAADAQAEAEAAYRTSQEVIDKVRVALAQLSGRDMTCSIAPPFPEAYEIMRQDFNSTVETLRDAFLNASDLAAAFTKDAQALAQDIIDMAGQSDQQVKRLGEVTQAAAALLEAFDATSDQAGQAATATGQARTSAERIDAVAIQAVSAMRDIEDSSRAISRIVDLIDDVAFQTNLLALNAGVEAARAGQSGKGFAVVATEVRHLAQSTSEAAAGIRKLISHSTEQVSTGAELVDTVGQSVSEILEQVAQASTLTDSISTRNLEQVKSLQSLHRQICEADRQTDAAADTGRLLASRSRKMTVASKKLSCDIEAFTFTEEDLVRGVSRT